MFAEFGGRVLDGGIMVIRCKASVLVLNYLREASILRTLIQFVHLCAGFLATNVKNCMWVDCLDGQ